MISVDIHLMVLLSCGSATESTLWDIGRIWKTSLQFVLFPWLFCELLSVVCKCIFRWNLLYVSCLHFSWWGTLHIMHINASFRCSNVCWIIIITIRICTKNAHVCNITEMAMCLTASLHWLFRQMYWTTEIEMSRASAICAPPSKHNRKFQFLKLVVICFIIHKFGSFIFFCLSISLLLYWAF